MPHNLPSAVLFVCSLNAVRSPMAEALMKSFYGTRIYVDSAGVKAGHLDPFVQSVLEEMSIERGAHTAKSLDGLEDHSFDLIIALTQEARRCAERFARGQAIDVEYWPVPDPTLQKGSRVQRLEAYRALRAELIHRLKTRFGAPDTPPAS